ncbi:MAG: hypothetical protein JST64_09130 [Actinobacteria bacterium]|nr:hypothetical protein [Actinomycetota bacterium]
MTAVGADPDALDVLAATMRSAASDLCARPRWTAAWSGPDAASFAWSLRSLESQRRRAGEDLVALARRLERAAQQQRRTSLVGPEVAVTVDLPSDGGRLLQRVGPSDAAVVVVVVPGVGTDRADRARLRSDATRIWWRLAERVDDPGRVAVLSWLGYDPPDRLLGALDADPADEGAGALVGEVERLRRAGASTVVVVGHSYGGVVAGRAAARGMRADAVVELGSPGSGAPGATSAIARRGVELTAVRAPGDPIGFVADRLPGLYGEDPVGQVRGLPTSLEGHSGYLSDPVLLDALADLVVGYRRSP